MQLLVRAGNIVVNLQAFSKAVVDITETADVTEEALLMVRPFTAGHPKHHQAIKSFATSEPKPTDLCLKYPSSLSLPLELWVCANDIDC